MMFTELPFSAEKSAERAAPRPSDKTVKLEQELTALVEAYKNALRFTSRLAWCEKIPVVEETNSERPDRPKESKAGHRLIVRPFVRLFVESHIRKTIDLLLNPLRIEAISLDEANPDAKRFAVWTKQLKETRESLRTWGSAHSLLTRAPFVSLLLPFIPPILLSLSGFDVSGPDKIVESFIALYQRLGSSIVSGLTMVATLVFFLYSILVPAVVRFGFRCKRAIFAAGTTDDYHLFGKSVINKVEKWENFPSANIYHLERAVFEALEMRKPDEFPLDLVLTPVPYIAFALACLITFLVVNDLRVGKIPHPMQWGLFLFVWAVTANVVNKARKYYRRRKKDRQM